MLRSAMNKHNTVYIYTGNSFSYTEFQQSKSTLRSTAASILLSITFTVLIATFHTEQQIQPEFHRNIHHTEIHAEIFMNRNLNFFSTL